MGDRNNPIKFGPEWLRNLARERNAGGSVNNGQNPTNSGISPTSGPTGSIHGVSIGTMSPPGPPGAMGVTGNPGGTTAQGAAGGSTLSNASTSSGANSRNSNNMVPKVLLAKLRYGREEMLALYDRSAEAPEELKYFDLLYQPRGKPPVALNNTFEDEMRDNVRGGPPIGAMLPAERFGVGRGMGRGSPNENRGRTRMPFVRQTSTGRGNSWHLGNTRLPGYNNSGTDEDTSQLRSWGASNGNNTTPRANNEQQEWTPNKVFRRRQANSTNWRQSHARDEGDEWRSPDAARNRPNADKWDRDWGERPAQDRPQSWNSNRRTWVGGEGHNDDNLPEWAVDNAEAGAGTFDSTGAFHGYSNDDTNLPRSQDSSFPLVRSHTHGSFVRSKTVEEGSEEWWVSEKAKKLSPKRFDAGDVKFKKSTNVGTSEANTGTSSQVSAQLNADKDDDSQEKSEKSSTAPEPPENTNASDDNKIAYKPKFSESKTFDALMRSDIDMEEAREGSERGNFQSVMITPNNSLRQKHQNIVASVTDNASRQGRIPVLQMLHSMPPNENDSRQTPEDKLVEDIFDLTLEDAKIATSNVTSNNSNSSSNPSDHRLATQMSSGMSISIPSPGMPNYGLSMNSTSTMSTSVLQGPTLATSGMQTSGMQTGGIQAGGLQTGGMQSSGMQSSGMQPGAMQQGGMQPVGLQAGGMQAVGMQPGGMHTTGLQSGGMQSGGIQSGGMQSGGMQSGGMQPSGMQTGVLQGGMQALQAAGMQTSVMPTPGLQNVGIPNSALNSSLGLTLGSANNAMVLPIQAVQPSAMPNSSLTNPGLGVANLQARGSVMPGFQTNSGLSVITGASTSLFLGQNSNPQMQPTNDLQMQNHGPQTNLFPMHGLQHSSSQPTFGSIYSNIMPPSQAQSAQNAQNLADQWYYEDPKKIIQGPFSSKEMYNWYRAGFFSPSLMVRRACDAHMRPLGSYGPMVPFAQIDILSPFPMSSGFETRTQGPHDLLNQQQGLGLDDSLWSQPTPSPDLMWVQQAMNARNDSRVNNLPLFFWDPQPSTISSNSLLPEEIAKEMKTEDQILAQLRASQNISTSQTLPFIGDQTSVSSSISNKPDEAYSPNVSATPNLEELQKLIQTDTLAPPSPPATITEPQVGNGEPEVQTEKQPKVEQIPAETNIVKQQQQIPNKVTSETKLVKSAKAENEKTVRSKETNNTKSKNKKSKEEKKEEVVDTKNKDEDTVKTEQKRSVESSPSKSKREDKQNKKEQEKERKEWLKEGFTIVKGSEKSTTKDTKKKVEETKISDEAERKRKEDEKPAADEKKEKKITENQKKQQELQLQRQSESLTKKAPWSAVATQQAQAINKDGLTLAEIQRLEREKKLEQMKVQQQMMQIIAQQQAATLAREQEMQAGLGWAKKKGANSNLIGQTLAEIQAEARRQSAAAVAAAAAAQALEEAQTAPPPQITHVPWGSSPNGGGFWDTQPNNNSKAADKPQESPKAVVEPNKSSKKKVVVTIPPKKETTPETEFELWCTTVLALWSSKIDVPTFVGFLKDIESPYEVKDYVKCYLGESKDSSDFARQFLERRSKLLRVGMVTPSDDLCSPAMAINPRTPSGSDYQEVKGKGKKTKKNKMLKVDARILGFSVTAAEDRINVGDIDTV